MKTHYFLNALLPLVITFSPLAIAAGEATANPIKKIYVATSGSSYGTDGIYISNCSQTGPCITTPACSEEYGFFVQKSNSQYDSLYKMALFSMRTMTPVYITGSGDCLAGTEQVLVITTGHHQ